MKLLSMRALFFTTLSSFSLVSYSMFHSIRSICPISYQQIRQSVQTTLNSTKSYFSPTFEQLPEHTRPLAQILFKNNNNPEAAVLSLLIQERYTSHGEPMLYLKNALKNNGADCAYAQKLYNQLVFKRIVYSDPLGIAEGECKRFYESVNAELIQAIENHDNKLLRTLHDSGAYPLNSTYVEIPSSHYNFHPRCTSVLIYALENNNTEIATMILNNLNLTTDINYRDSSDKTALRVALQHKHYAVAALILKHPYFNARHLSTDSLLTEAIYNRDAQAVNVLLEHPKIPLIASFCYDQNALNYAIRCSAQEIACTLLQHPRVHKEINIEDALQYAMILKKQDMIILLKSQRLKQKIAALLIRKKQVGVSPVTVK